MEKEKDSEKEDLATKSYTTHVWLTLCVSEKFLISPFIKIMKEVTQEGTMFKHGQEE